MAIETEQRVILPRYDPAPFWRAAPVKDMLALSRNVASRYGLLVAFAVLWQISPSLGWTNPAVLPPLDMIIAALWNGVTTGTFAHDIAVSLQRAGIAFGAAVGLGIPLGLFMGQVRIIERSLDPILQLFRQTSALALYPVFILLLGLGETSKVFVIFWATLFPILLATIGGVKQVDAKLVEMARVYGAKRLTVFRRVVLPWSMTGVLSGALVVFVPTVGDYVTPALVGGPQSTMIGSLIQAQFGKANDWPFGAALSVSLIVLILSLILIARFAGSRGGRIA